MRADTAILVPAGDALAEAFAGSLGHAGGAADLTEAEAVFLAQMREDYVPEELPGTTLADLAANLADFWRFAGRRAQPGPAMQIVEAIGGDGRIDRLDIVQDDSPFLVDSVMAEIADAGVLVRAMFHGMVDVARDHAGRRIADGPSKRESTIQVMLDGLDADRAADLVSRLEATLADVRLAVGDYPAMLALMDRALEDIQAAAPRVTSQALQEYVTFLRWVRDNHFIFLGARVYDYPRTPDGGYAPDEPLYQPEDSLGVLRDPSRAVLRRASEPAVLNSQLRRHLEEDPPLVVAKSNLLSHVHRRGYMDYVGVRRYGEDGKPAGEIRFVGLFTSEAYDTPVQDVPLLRRKVAYVLEHTNKTPGGHSDRRLRNILANYPRDELFQTGEDDLLRIALGIVHLNDRPRVRLFARMDPFDRFLSVQLYVPLESYDSSLISRAGAVLAEAFEGRIVAAHPSLTAGSLARVHYIVGVTPGAHPQPPIEALEARIAEVARTWPSRLEAALRAEPATSGRVGELLPAYRSAFPPGYQDLYDAAEALRDIEVIEALAPGEPAQVRAFRRDSDSPRRFRFKLYCPGQAAPLAAVLPILEDMGLEALVEEGFPIRRAGLEGVAAPIWVHEFILEDERGETLEFSTIKAPFEAAFLAVWTGRTESDGFNRLVLELAVSWREAALMRAFARYRQQSGMDPSQAVQEAALRDNPAVSRLILELFRTKFDPEAGGDRETRLERAKALDGEIVEALRAVDSLDADRVLRRIGRLALALVRTNYYQPGPDGAPKPYISFKLASRDLDDLPAPKPFREIFVWAPHVEGVHLRFGPVARGGLRWSDRRDDFRTEILGLVKAQQVKNAVIVPVGSKGGFYPKQLPRGGAPEAVQAEAIRAYRTFLCGLLDLTDNLSPAGQVIPPEGVVVLDRDDPYLVVAADKGTASFSDIANGVAEDYGFWLGDAFASGGSAGYDHKVMGITARGAWEAVKRHFRELGKDIQTQPFTVIGVGDMSGDVFGNGMLLSEQTRLVAAFDHRHVFIDPDPDPAASFAERKRLFELPRSSWDDYDRGLISKGGGVFARTLKSVSLSPEIRALLDLTDEALTPAELIHAILKARAELLYLGGVGTYVKAPSESHADVGDKANDLVRIDATELRCRVVGEGANLGVTQAGRIAFARAGGRIDTDAIDNSAGVDTSDHEVNIKILTGMAERAGELSRKRRDRLLQSMTDDVAGLVLQHNYDQTLALSLLERDAPAELGQQARFMADLEARGRLDRQVEGLPDAAAIAELTQAGAGLTRPELAVLLAYGKLDLDADIVSSGAPDDPYFEGALEHYFPHALRRFEDEMKRHRLRREIISTVVCNDIVNICGPTFAGRLKAAADADTAALVTGHQAAKQVLRIDQHWSAIAALDGQVPATAQMAMFAELSAVLRATTYWMTRRAGHKGAGAFLGRAIKRTGTGRANSPIRQLIDAYRPAAGTLMKAGATILSPIEQAAVEQRTRAFVAAGAPEDLAADVALLRPLITAADIGDLASLTDRPVESVARLYHQAGAAFGFDQLRAAAAGLATGDDFERLALRRLVEDMLQEQSAVTRAMLKHARAFKTNEEAQALVADWSAGHELQAAAARATIQAIEAAGEPWSFAKLTIVNAALRELAVAAR
ncbi:MAG: NAD-glutamate dehydrogenase [Caulobacteraceae bacterium]|nr:NAD-glutamate dehydrogenase [Caulobacteraceae bacterium]